MRITPKLSIITIAVVVGIAALLTLVPWQCTEAQTFSAGTFELAQPYQAVHDEIMTAKYGPNWETVMQKELKEHLRNRLSEARESFRSAATDSVALDDEQLELLTAQEKLQVDQATKELRIAAERIKAYRIAQLKQRPRKRKSA